MYERFKYYQKFISFFWEIKKINAEWAFKAL